MDFKSFSEPLEVAEDRTVTGYLAAFNTEDREDDIIRPGAFKKTISESWKNDRTRIKYLLDHDKHNVVGVFTELKEDDYGLFYKARIATHTKGEDYYRMVKDGIVDQHSIGYMAVEHKKEGRNRILTQIRLFEGSGIQFRAAHPDTPILSVKEIDHYDRELGRLEWALKNGSYSDGTFEVLEKRLKSIQEILRKTTRPETSTLPDFVDTFIKHF